METKFAYVAIDGKEFKNCDECVDYEIEYLEEHAEFMLDSKFEITTNKNTAFYLSFNNKAYAFNEDTGRYEKMCEINKMIKNDIYNLEEEAKRIEIKLDNLYKEKKRLDKAIDSFNNCME